MRIGIDARFFGPIGKGLGRYTQRLIEHLETTGGSHEFVVFLRKENFDLYHPASPRFRKVLADFPWYGASEQLRYPSLIRKEGIELMHFPHFNVPLATPCPFVVTIHDLILLRYPTTRATTLNRVLYAAKYAAYRLVILSAVRRARRIIAVSEFTKRDIARAFRVPEKKIVVTYEASDGVEAGQLAVPGTTDLATKGVAGPYFLYVGNAYPHKNLERLLRVFARMRADGFPGQLVLVGKRDYFYDRLTEESVETGLRADGVVFWGYATEAELADLYRGARAYVFPSLFEGFGLPPLEAMRYDAPVVSSNATCLPEILGDAALYFDPHDEDDMKRKMLEIYDDKDLADALVEKGRRRTERFSWEETARGTLGVYDEALAH